MKLKPDEKRYLGDGVYVTHDGWGYWLETERNGHTERIYLEPGMVTKLIGMTGKASS